MAETPTDTKPQAEASGGALAFLWEHKRYWLVPLVLAVLLLVLLAASSSAALTPFIYTVF